MPSPRPRSQTNAPDYEEPPRRFHDLEPLLAAATRGETAAAEQALHEALASGSCVWGYRKHRMVKNGSGPDVERVCSRCGYGPKEDTRTHGTSGGVELTGKVIERLAAEAEQGHDVGQLKSRARTGVTKLETTDDITEEIVILIWGIIADRYRDSATNWHAVWEVAQGTHLEDGTLLDLGSDYDSPVLRELKDRAQKS